MTDEERRWEELETRLLLRVTELLEHVHTVLHNEMRNIMASLDAITAAVTAQETVQASIIELLNGIAAQLTEAIANGADPVAIQAIADQISADTATLSDAVVANTPPA